MSAHCTREPAAGIVAAPRSALRSARVTASNQRGGIEADGVADPAIGARAEAQQRAIEIRELGGQSLRGRRRRDAAARKRAAQTIERAGMAVPRRSALRNAVEDQRFALGGATATLLAAHDRPLERLERCDLAHADVTIADRAATVADQPAGRTPTTSSTIEQHRDDGDARRDRELEQRRSALLSHGRSRLTLIASPSIAMLTTSEVMPKLTNGNVTPVSGSTARLPATVTASWHSARTTHVDGEPAQERLVVVDDAPRAATMSRGSPRVTRPWCRMSRCSQSAQPIVTAQAAVQPNAPTSAVNV